MVHLERKSEGKKGESAEGAEERKKEESRILEEVESRKQQRQAAFKSKMNLIVDVPRAGGSGNSNTGNVARRAFSDSKTFSEITEVNEELIYRIHILHIVFNTDEEIDDVAVREYGRETAALWIRLYPWYPMPVSLHQLLIHGHEAIKMSSLPVSFLTEQSLESTNKSLKYDQTHHSQKTSRLDMITDIFNRQNDRSNLKIAMKIQERRRRRPKNPVLPEVKALLKNGADDSD